MLLCYHQYKPFFLGVENTISDAINKPPPSFRVKWGQIWTKYMPSWVRDCLQHNRCFYLNKRPLWSDVKNLGEN